MSKWHYFITKTENWGGYAFMVSNDKGGHLIRKNGSVYNTYIDTSWVYDSFNLRKDYKQVSIKKAFGLIENKDRIKEILDFLNEELPKPIELTKEIKEVLLYQLQTERAFNGDSAFKSYPEQLESYEILAEQGLVKSINREYFYIDK